MLFDTHTHVQFEDYDADREAVLLRAREAGVWMVNVGTNFASSEKAVALAHTEGEGIFASVGLHPNDIAPDVDFAPFEKLAQDKAIVGIGETGLDYYRIRNNELGITKNESETKKLQHEFFIKHIELSRRIRKPLIIHCREAHEDLLPILNSYFLTPDSHPPGVMHFFGGAGAWESLDAYLEMGFYISFAGVVTFSNYTHTEDIKRIPLERIVVETDAPYATPVPFRGTRNEPAFVRHTVEKLAQIRGRSFEEMAEHTSRNARMLFGV